MATGELKDREETVLLSRSILSSSTMLQIARELETPVLLNHKKRRKRLKRWDGVGEDGAEERAYWIDSWKNTIRTCWPDCLTRTIIVPTITFNRVQYSDCTIGKDTIKIPRPDVQLSDVREDESRRRIHNAMCGDMFEGSSEGMVIRFGLSYDNYLNNARPKTGSRNKRRADKGLESRDVRSTPKRKFLCQRHQFSFQSDQDSSKVVWTINGSIVPTSSDMYQCTECHPWNNHSREQSSQNGIKSLDDTGSTDGVRRIPDLSKFPRPRDMEPNFRRGEFDLLIIHPQRGIIVVEVKTVGDVFGLSLMDQRIPDQFSMIRTRIRKAVAQLDKHVEVLNHILPDVHQKDIPITKGLALPNLRRQSVLFALMQDNDVTESLCKSFGVHNLNQALRRCLFSEDLPPIGQALDVKDDVTKRSLRAWWKSFANSSGPCMTEDLYEAVIARLCGPATKQYEVTAGGARAEISTLSQAVMETSRCFTQPVLTDEQVQILNSSASRLSISGPPGTGKTLMLKLKIKECLREGQVVLIVSLWTGSHAVSYGLYHQIREEMETENEKLHLGLEEHSDLQDSLKKMYSLCERCGFWVWTLPDRPPLLQVPRGRDTLYSPDADSGFSESQQTYDSDDEDDFNYVAAAHDEMVRSFRMKPYNVQFLSESVSRQTVHPDSTTTGGCGKLYVVVDEAPWFLDTFVTMLETLLGKDGFVIWVASSYPSPQRNGWSRHEVTRSLRCPPVVVRQMTQTPAYVTFKRPGYTSQDAGVLSSMPSPTDGPPVKVILHHRSHGVAKILDCSKCAEELVSFLTNDLLIGKSAAGTSTSVEEPEEAALHFSDVLISGFLPNLQESVKGTTTAEHALRGFFTTAKHALPGFFRGLKTRGVDCDLITKSDIKSHEKLAVPRNKDCVQVAQPELIAGLERAVVVVIGTGDFASAAPRYVDPYFDVMARCTSQLVLVEDAEQDIVDKLRNMSVSVNNF